MRQEIEAALIIGKGYVLQAIRKAEVDADANNLNRCWKHLEIIKTAIRQSKEL